MTISPPAHGVEGRVRVRIVSEAVRTVMDCCFGLEHQSSDDPGPQVAEWAEQAMAEHEAGAQGASMARHAVQLLRPLLRDGVPPGGGAPTWAHSRALLDALASLAAVLSRQLPRLGAASIAPDGSEVGIIRLQIDLAVVATTCSSALVMVYSALH